MACGILIPQSQVEPEALGWESWVQDTRLLENSWSQGVLISGNSHKDLHLYPRLGTTPLLASPRAECLTQTTSKTRIQTQSLVDRLPTDIPEHNHLTQPCPSEGKKIQPLPTRTQAQVPPNKRRTQATGLTTPTKGREQKLKEPWPYNLGKGDIKHGKS